VTERQFAGAAQDYARYRLPYPDRLIEDLVEAAGPGGELLDLACGTANSPFPSARTSDGYGRWTPSRT
jgi:hypothetical protein